MKFLSSDLAQSSFAEMSFPPELAASLAKLKIEVPTQIQKQALPVALAGSDLVGLAETGSGKTLVYILAILNKLMKDTSARALILTPSRETADQVFRVLNQVLGDLSMTTCLVVGGLPEKEQISKLKKNPRIVIATPGRMNDHLSHNKLLLQKLAILVVDEADRMFDKGLGPQLKKIRATLRGEIQTLMFGASFNPATQKAAQEFFRPETYLVKSEGAEKPVENLKQKVILTDRSAKKERLLEILKTYKGSAIVFVNDQPNSESVHHHLSENGFSVDMIHGALKHGHRDRVMRDFRNGEFQILVTTDLLARGLDIPDIELVINFDLPNAAEDFIHRIGRTARGGKSGTAITFVSRSEEKIFESFKPYLENAEVIR